MEHHRYLSDEANREFAYYLPAAMRSRIITTLNKNGVRYLHDLILLTKQDLLKFPNLGCKSDRYIKDALNKMDLRLSE